VFREETAASFARKSGKPGTGRCIGGGEVFFNFHITLYFKNAENVGSNLSFYESCLRRRGR
jgi:hypothetical protein